MGFLLARIFGISSTIKDRQVSIRQSKASILGHVKEQLAPISPGFPYHTKDMVFIGK
jgi:predicted Holliday junction resolvase-like endonuclease